eukprot:434449-Rhodomonas_salina.1
MQRNVATDSRSRHGTCTRRQPLTGKRYVAGDLFPYGSYFYNLTGSTDYDNCLVRVGVGVVNSS